MLSKIGLAVMVTALVGCSSMQVAEDELPIKAEFMGGKVVVVYDKEGRLESIESTSTARVVSSLPNAVDESFIVATLKARNQIAEFMNVDVESEKFVDTVFDSLQTAENASTNKNQNIARKVQNNIRQKTTAILKGTFVSKKDFDSSTRTVSVTVSSSEREIAAAKRLQTLMAR